MNPFENAPSKLSSSMSNREFAYLCMAKWKWFALSLAVFLTLAVAYLLRTPNTYTRNASVLIKEESRGKGINSDVASQLSSMGLFTANSNVYNEVINFQSPDLMYEVVKRLKLNITYQKDGTFHKVDLYGTTLPVNVEFKSLGNNDDATLTIVPKGKDQVQLKDFTYMGGSLDGEVTVKIGDKVKTPLGFLRVVKSADKQIKRVRLPHLRHTQRLQRHHRELRPPHDRRSAGQERHCHRPVLQGCQCAEGTRSDQHPHQRV